MHSCIHVLSKFYNTILINWPQLGAGGTQKLPMKKVPNPARLKLKRQHRAARRTAVVTGDHSEAERLEAALEMPLTPTLIAALTSMLTLPLRRLEAAIEKLPKYVSVVDTSALAAASAPSNSTESDSAGSRTLTLSPEP